MTTEGSPLLFPTQK